MKTEQEIKERIKSLNDKLIRQGAHAVKMEGDGEEHSRELALVSLRAIKAVLKWVLNPDES